MERKFLIGFNMHAREGWGNGSTVLFLIYVYGGEERVRGKKSQKYIV